MISKAVGATRSPTTHKRGAQLETHARCYRTYCRLSRRPSLAHRECKGEGASGPRHCDVTARGGRAVSVRPAVELSGRVHDARAVNKTIAMLFESPNAKLFPAFNIPPPVRLR